MVASRSKALRSHVLALGLILAAFTMSMPAASAPDTGGCVNQAKNPLRIAGGPQIECITPDGHVSHVAPASPEKTEPAALIMDSDTVRCSLQEGETNFVITLPTAALIDRLTFLNENAAAQGELRIAVSNCRLPADSPKWIPVEGTIPFAHKRMFAVSLLGLESKFVKVSFRVAKTSRIAAVEF